MKKKMITGLTLLVFVCSIFLLMVSCAKKQVRTEPVQPTEVVKEVDTGKEAPGETDAERQARLRELERAQSLADQARMFETDNIYFDFDKSELRPEAKVILKRKSDFLRVTSSSSVRIEGHCDERGSNEYNLALGERRANAIERYLNALGISGDRLSTISYGEEKPADPGHKESAWAKNRRGVCKLIK